MKNNLKGKINIYKNKTISRNQSKNKTKNITYNKPLFINMNSNNYFNNNNTYKLLSKNSSCSTKICSPNSESPFKGIIGNNNTSRVDTVKDFELENNCLKTSSNFFSNYMNTSISYSDDNNNYETFTPSRKKDSPFNDDDKEQFTPYLGQKKTNENRDNESKKPSLNKNINNVNNNNYSIIFNNSKNEIESASLNLCNHFDEQLSNKYKIINKYQKLSFYQKKIGVNNHNQSRNENKNNTINANYTSISKLKNTKSIKKQFLYKKKTDLSFQRENERKILEWFYIHNIDISERELYEKYVILIQTIFRGYISRIKLYNKLKIYTCITVLCQIINNIYLERNKFILKRCFRRILKYENKKLNIYNISFTIEGCEGGKENKKEILCEEIKELIDQNNELQIKLNQFLINNNILKNEVNNYKEFENKYNKLLIQLEKLHNANDSLIKHNTELVEELNYIKNNQKLGNLIKPQNVESINLKSAKSAMLNEIKIVNNINDIIIKGVNIKNNNMVCSNIVNLTLLNKIKSPE